MGSDKARLPWNARLLVEEIAATVADAAGNVALIGESARYQDLGIDCFPDLRPGLGPLAGIETALLTRRGELNLILACDMPGVKSTWLRQLLEEAQKSDALCLATRDASARVHPLCAVYRSECVSQVQSALEAGRFKLLDLLKNLNAATLESHEPMSNVNTPEEWAAFGN
jgi:molybdopterin-guanine dinucleotide biosynthesis protein A